ncbi:hypothetical protein CPC16_001399, partial [Podila verticillata]
MRRVLVALLPVLNDGVPSLGQIIHFDLWDRIIKTWRGALSYLQQHSSLEKRQLYGTLREYTSVELEKIVDKELQEREHDYTLLVNASRQELAASHMHTKQVEERFEADIISALNDDTCSHIYDDTYNHIYGETYDEDLDDDEVGDDPVLDPHTSRARVSPFYELVDFIFKKTQGQDPPLPFLPSGLSPTYSEMFHAALQLLQEPGDVTRKKPVFTLVSGIINTLSPVSQQFTLSPLVEEQSRMACLSYHSNTIDDLRADLQEALYPDPDDPAAMSVESLQRFVYESLLQCLGPHPTRAAKEKYLILKIVSQVLHWLENDIFAVPLSEHVSVSAWSDVLNMLFAQSGLCGIP